MTVASRRDRYDKRLVRIEKKLDYIIGALKVNKVARATMAGAEPEIKQGGALDIMTLLSLPDHLRKTALTLIKLGRATAEDVARETGRARAIESAYLNQLARMKYVWSERVGKRVHFTVVGMNMAKKSKSRECSE
ncbi:MAG: transcriptional regulator [Planctomycetes bacterium]|nr:transcriptional regulator [Planctomycetota bacterium]